MDYWGFLIKTVAKILKFFLILQDTVMNDCKWASFCRFMWNINSRKTMITFGFRNSMSGVLRAVAAIALGIVMIAMPESSLVVLVKILAAILIASGLVSVVFGIMNRDNGGLGLMVFNSVVDIILGILMFCFPSFVASFIIIVLGVALLCMGLFQIAALISATSFVRMGFFAFIFPALAVAGGFLLIFKPFGIASVLTLVSGIVLLVYGVSELVSSWKMHKAMKEYEIKFHPSGTAGHTGEPSEDGGMDNVKDVDFEKADSPEGR